MPDSLPDATPSLVDRRLTALGIVLAAGLAAWLRVANLGHGYDGDEVSNLIPGGLVWQFYDSETLVNPPLTRWMIALSPGPDPLGVARAISAAFNVLGVAIGAWIAAQLGGRWWYAWMAGAMLAVNAQMVSSSVTARSYGLWVGLLAVHLLALVRWADRPSRRSAAAVAASAVLLPWVHYVNVTWLLGVGVLAALSMSGRRSLPLLYAPAAVGALPLAWRLAGHVSRRESPVHGVGRVLDQIVGLDLGGGGLPRLFDGPPDVLLNPNLPAFTVLVTLLACVALWRHLRPSFRIAVIGACMVPLSVMPFAAVHLVRAPQAVIMVIAAVPVLAAASSLWRWPAVRVLSSVIATLWFARMVQIRNSNGYDAKDISDAERAVSEEIRAGAFPAGDIAVCPQGLLIPMAYYLTGLHVRALPDAPQCAGVRGCEFVAGRRLIPCDTPTAGIAPNVLHFDDRFEGEVPGCTRVAAVPGMTRWTCP